MTVDSPIPRLPDDDAGLDQLYAGAPAGVRANMVMTVDAQFASNGRTQAVTNPPDQALLRHLRSHADAVVVGAGTVRAEGYGPVNLSQEQRDRRTSAGRSETPPLVIVTARGRLDPDSRLFRGDDDPRPVVVTTNAGAENARLLGDAATIVVAGEDRVDAGELVNALKDLGLTTLLCEGGPSLLADFIAADLLDELCLTLSPHLAGVQALPATKPASLEIPTALRLRHVLSSDDFLYLRYTRR